MRKFVSLFFISLLVIGFLPVTVFAAPGPVLQALYTKQSDLQAWFDPVTYLVKPGAETAATSLEDWARQYGWRENSSLLFYKPKGVIPVAVKNGLPPAIFAADYIVIDQVSGLIVAEQNAGVARPIASLTKLMTTDIVLSHNVSSQKVQPIVAADQVGGSRLGVPAGTKFTISDLFYAALLPSANDAANALADSTSLSRPDFIGAMNAEAQKLVMPRTIFTDPTGIDEGNVSTARELALLAQTVFQFPTVRRDATTLKHTLIELPSKKKLTVKNSDFLLTQPQYSDVYVTAGKTGYLGPELGWNVVVSLKNVKGTPHELLLVLFGEPKLAKSMADADELAEWTWGHYKWE